MMMWLIMAPGFMITAGLISQLLIGGDFRTTLVLGIALCVVLFIALLYRPTRWYAAAITLILPAVLAVLFHPVCQPLTAEEVARMSPGIEQRTDHDFFMPIFQQQTDGSWAQCKTQISRWFFF